MHAYKSTSSARDVNGWSSNMQICKPYKRGALL
jgi:hypothetical protein